jgi:hypothetical protein
MPVFTKMNDWIKAGGLGPMLMKSETPDVSAMADTQTLTGTTDPATTVDPGVNSNQINQLGRAALISTSSQGVKGTDETGRYRLLGN